MSSADAGLLPLAALLVGASQDPVRAAADFLETQPPATTTAAEWARAIMELATTPTP